MKKRLTIIALAFTGLVSFAQQDAQFSMYMFNRLAINPGYAGINQALCGTLLYRNQWTGWTGNPQTGLLSVDFGPLAHGGVGLTIDQDELGTTEKTLAAKAAYSYHLDLAGGVLGIGLDAGMLNKSISSENFIAPDGSTTKTGGGTDAAIPWNGASATTYDVGLGLYFTKGPLYAGLSCLHIPGSGESFKKEVGIKPPAGTPSTYTDFTYEMARHYYVMAGYTFNLSPKFDLTPSFLVKSDASSSQFDFNLMAKYNNMVFVGASYRATDAIPLMVGLELPMGFKLAYSYDVLTSNINTQASGSHEIMLGYCHKFIKTPKKNGHTNEIMWMNM